MSSTHPDFRPKHGGKAPRTSQGPVPNAKEKNKGKKKQVADEVDFLGKFTLLHYYNCLHYCKKFLMKKIKIMLLFV